MYRFCAPWDTGIPAPELVRTVAGLPPGRAIDIGCGTGTNLLYLARRGWRVAGVDFVPRALAMAREKLKSFSPDLAAADVTRLPDTQLPGPYDLALDLGCFHGLTAEGRAKYSETLARRLVRGGLFLLYAWQPASPRDRRGISREEVVRCFSESFTLYQYEQGTGRPSAWYYFRRKE
jgi:SAM-dependent methyltransferase